MRVVLEQPFLDEFFASLCNSKDFMSWAKFSKKVSCSRWTLGGIKNHKRSFPKKVFEELLQFVSPNKKDYFLSKAKYIASCRWNKISSEIEESLRNKTSSHYLKLKARLCGHLSGDGLVASRRNGSQKSLRYDIAFFPDNLEMAKKFNDAFYALYGRKLAIRRDRNDAHCILKSTHKIAYSDLIKICRFGTHEWRAPIAFLKTDSMRSEWLKAFFDCEAYVGKNKIQVQSVNKAGLCDVKALLERLGIEASKIYEYKRKQKNWSTNYLLEIRKKNNLKNYLKLIGFNHSIKRDKLESQLAGMAESG